jgi:hypothetical protein
MTWRERLARHAFMLGLVALISFVGVLAERYFGTDLSVPSHGLPMYPPRCRRLALRPNATSAVASWLAHDWPLKPIGLPVEPSDRSTSFLIVVPGRRPHDARRLLRGRA